MLRFYCLTCKKVKRVRIFPNSVVSIDSTDPIHRLGICRWHTASAGVTHAQAIDRKRVRHQIFSSHTHKLSASAQKQKSKRK